VSLQDNAVSEEDSESALAKKKKEKDHLCDERELSHMPLCEGRGDVRVILNTRDPRVQGKKSGNPGSETSSLHGTSGRKSRQRSEKRKDGIKEEMNYKRPGTHSSAVAFQRLYGGNSSEREAEMKRGGRGETI